MHTPLTTSVQLAPGPGLVAVGANDPTDFFSVGTTEAGVDGTDVVLVGASLVLLPQPAVTVPAASRAAAPAQRAKR